MTAVFTAILPHRRNPGNDRALAIALSCLFDNTVNDFKLLMDAAYDQPLYPRINRMVEQADTECCVYLASDHFVAPGWDVPMLQQYDERSFVNGVIVEPGAIGVHHLNLYKDFGRKPETFRRAEFEAWVASGDAPLLDGQGWYAGYMFPRTGWLEHGGYEVGLEADIHGFTCADIELFERWQASGNRIVRVPSFAYHLQRWSETSEQTDGKRDM